MVEPLTLTVTAVAVLLAPGWVALTWKPASVLFSTAPRTPRTIRRRVPGVPDACPVAADDAAAGWILTVLEFDWVAEPTAQPPAATAAAASAVAPILVRRVNRGSPVGAAGASAPEPSSSGSIASRSSMSGVLLNWGDPSGPSLPERSMRLV